MGPDFGQVKRIDGVMFGLIFGHHLDFHCPAWEVTLVDRMYQVCLHTIGRHFGGFVVGQCLNALVGFEVPLDPNTLTFVVPHAQSVRAVTIHVAQGFGNAPVRHQHGDLMHGLRIAGPELKVVSRFRQVGFRVLFLRVNKIRELGRITNKEHRGVITDDVVIALFGVKTQRKAAHVTDKIT